MNKKAITLNVSSSDEASKLKKLSKKEIGKNIGGDPDDWDYNNIKVLMDSYEKAYPGRLQRMSNDYRLEYALSGRDKYGIVSGDADRRLVMWMPADLEQVVSASYPSLWTNKKHMAWFIRRFPIFAAADKY